MGQDLAARLLLTGLVREYLISVPPRGHPGPAGGRAIQQVPARLLSPEAGKAGNQPRGPISNIPISAGRSRPPLPAVRADVRTFAGGERGSGGAGGGQASGKPVLLYDRNGAGLFRTDEKTSGFPGRPQDRDSARNSAETTARGAPARAPARAPAGPRVVAPTGWRRADSPGGDFLSLSRSKDDARPAGAGSTRRGGARHLPADNRRQAGTRPLPRGAGTADRDAALVRPGREERLRQGFFGRLLVKIRGSVSSSPGPESRETVVRNRAGGPARPDAVGFQALRDETPPARAAPRPAEDNRASPGPVVPGPVWSRNTHHSTEPARRQVGPESLLAFPGQAGSGRPAGGLLLPFAAGLISLFASFFVRFTGRPAFARAELPAPARRAVLSALAVVLGGMALGFSLLILYAVFFMRLA